MKFFKRGNPSLPPSLASLLSPFFFFSRLDVFIYCVSKRPGSCFPPHGQELSALSLPARARENVTMKDLYLDINVMKPQLASLARGSLTTALPSQHIRTCLEPGMTKDGEEAGNIIRKCVIRFAREKGADVEMRGTQKGKEGTSEQKESSCHLQRDQMCH